MNMKNKLLITTALVALTTATNAYAETLPSNASDLTTGNYVVEHTGSPITHEGDIKISQEAMLNVETYASINVEEDMSDTRNIFNVSGNLEVGDEQNGGGTLNLFRNDNEKPMMSVSGNMTINNGATVNMKNDSGRFATILVNKNANINGGELNLNGGDLFVTQDVNISGGNINITQGEIATNTGNINMTGGQVNLSGEASLNAGGTLTIGGGEISMHGDETIKYSSALSGNSLKIADGKINITGKNNEFETITDVEMSGGELNIAENAILNIRKSESSEEDAPTSKGTISHTNGNINLSGILDGNISGNGALNIQSSVANINGNVTNSKLSFETDHSLSKAISGTIGDLASLNVNKGTLTYDKQTGKIGNLNVAGGLDIGTNTVNATEVDFKENSTLKFTVAGKEDGSYGKIKADTINVSNTGTKLDLTLNSSVLAKDEAKDFTILDGSVTGDFAELSENSRYKFEKIGNGVYKITGTATASDTAIEAGGTANNAGTATAWDSVSLDNPSGSVQRQVANVLAELSNKTNTAAGKKAYVNALTAVAPEVAPMVQQTQSETANQVFGAVGTRLTGSSVSTGAQGMSSGDNIFKRGAMWVQGMFNKSKLDDTSKAKGFDADSNGIAFGAEKYVNDDVKAGIGYAYTNTDIDGFMRSTDVDTHTAIVYGEYKPSNWYVNGIATYGWSDYSEDKNVAGVGVKADYDVETFGLQAMTGYDMNINGFGVTPEAGLRYVHIKQDAYKDSADQKISGNDSDILTGVIGAKVSKNFELSNGMNIKPEARIAATYDLMNDDVNSVVTLANGSAYAVEGEALDRFGMEFGAGVTAEVNDNVELSLGYEGKFREDYQDHTGLINAKYKF